MYRKKPNGWLRFWDFMLIDLVCIQLSFADNLQLLHGAFRRLAEYTLSEDCGCCRNGTFFCGFYDKQLSECNETRLL